MVNRFVFVGERPSKRALQIGATWENAKLAGNTLRKALCAAGIEPEHQLYLNLFGDTAEAEISLTNTVILRIKKIKRLHKDGHVIVAMGRRVAEMLTHFNLPHRRIFHPAARGKIRKRELYHQHIRQVLLTI
jgi:uracil-DNA glycosylase